ncbi:L-aspartate--glyoxylate aminotransferase BhcA [Candidatus Njordibacter sp. Uisw_002]|jgi:alanine-glyoxylate transaminase/serine-glyoxylate transaminase/serine-pyruvate transaminase|uniref:L-aspartate--glyoxylate aminotransferase BhcA n=1 Tax=Candidatus Njordibacter sp. Uisw_002 TaxID=3230971 RepID=UPI003D51540F|tara:strand:- start:1147 stop:2319 length:1173 start_codon:yes stop_codon:yes gene_type:complete
MKHQNPIFIPGPSNTPDVLKAAMNISNFDHRAPDFAQDYIPLLNDLKKVFKTQTGQVLLFSATGTGGWEGAISNTLCAGDKVLIARYGMFSQRWIDLCQRFGLDVEVVECVWGTGAPVDEFARRLKADIEGEIKAVLVTHNETATAVKSDVFGVRKAMDNSNHKALLMVDAVSSLASMDFQMDGWGVDIAITGAQKGFMLNTGLAIVGVSPKAMAATKTATLPRCFFDFNDMANANKIGSYPYTPPVQLFNGLRASVKLLLDEGMDNVNARHHRIAQGVRAAVKAWGLELCAQSPELYSDTVTAIMVPEGKDSNLITQHAYESYGVSFGGGLGEMAGKLFRIGHLGAMTDVMALSGIATAEMVMKDLGYDIVLGSGVAAAQKVYQRGIAS